MEWKNIIREIEDHSTMQLFCLHGTDLPSLSEIRVLLEQSKEFRIAGTPFKTHDVILLTSRAQYIRKHHHEGLFFQQRYQASYKDQGETVRQRLEKQVDSNSVNVLIPWIEAFELEEIYDKPLIQLSSGNGNGIRFAKPS